MAKLITWRNVAAPSLNQASYGGAANSAFGMAGSAFSKYGNFLGDRAEQRATSAAIQEALRTGSVPQNLDSRVDIGAVLDARGAQLENRGTELLNTGRVQQNEGFRLDNLINQFTVDNQEENLKLEQDAKKAATEASRANTRANNNSANLSAYELTQLKTNDQLAKEATAAQERISNWRGEQITARADALVQAGGIDPRDALAQARTEVDTELGNMYSNDGLHREFGISKEVLNQTEFGRNAREVQLAASKALAEQKVKNQNLSEKEAQNWEGAVDRFMNGNQVSGLYLDKGGNYSLRTDKNIKPYESTTAKNKIHAVRQSDTGDVKDLSGLDNYQRAMSALTGFDPTLADAFIKNANEVADSDQEYLNAIVRQANLVLNKLQDPEARKEMVTAISGPGELSEMEQLQIALGDSSQAPANGEGYTPFDLKSAASNRGGEYSVDYGVGRSMPGLLRVAEALNK